MGLDAELVRVLGQAILLVAERAIESADAHCPHVTLERFETAPWASATFSGHRHEFELLLAGEEDAVDGLANAMIQDFLNEDLRVAGNAVADIAHTHTDKIVDGEGAAAVRLRFEALSVSD